MKRELFKNVRVIPSADGKVVDREEFLSGVLAVSVGTFSGSPDSAVLSLTFEHSDTVDGEFVAVPDTMLNPEQATKNGGIPQKPVSSGEEILIDLDLLGCKRYVKVGIKVTFSGGTNPAAAGSSCVMVLGDPVQSPV